MINSRSPKLGGTASVGGALLPLQAPRDTWIAASPSRAERGLLGGGQGTFSRCTWGPVSLRMGQLPSFYLLVCSPQPGQRASQRKACWRRCSGLPGEALILRALQGLVRLVAIFVTSRGRWERETGWGQELWRPRGSMGLSWVPRLPGGGAGELPLAGLEQGWEGPLTSGWGCCSGTEARPAGPGGAAGRRPPCAVC